MAKVNGNSSIGEKSRREFQLFLFRNSSGFSSSRNLNFVEHPADARSSMRLKPKSMNLSFINSKLIEASFFRLEIYPKFLLVKSESRHEPYQ